MNQASTVISLQENNTVRGNNFVFQSSVRSSGRRNRRQNPMKDPSSQRIYSENDSVVVDKKKALGILRERATQKQKQ